MCLMHHATILTLACTEPSPVRRSPRVHGAGPSDLMEEDEGEESLSNGMAPTPTTHLPHLRRPRPAGLVDDGGEDDENDDDDEPEAAGPAVGAKRARKQVDAFAPGLPASGKAKAKPVPTAKTAAPKAAAKASKAAAKAKAGAPKGGAAGGDAAPFGINERIGLLYVRTPYKKSISRVIEQAVGSPARLAVGRASVSASEREDRGACAPPLEP